MPVEWGSRSSPDPAWQRPEDHRAIEAAGVFHAAFAAYPDPVLVVGSDRRVHLANPAAEHLFSEGSSDLLERPIESLVTKADQRVCLHAFSEALDGRGSSMPLPSQELAVVTAEGRSLGATLILSSIEIGGEPAVVAIVRPPEAGGLDDARQRHRELEQAHEAVRYQRTLLASQNEASIDGILIVDEENRVVSYNQRFVDLWGLDDDAIEVGEPDERAFESVLPLISDLEGFLERVEALVEDPLARLRDEVDLEDGRTLERWTTPVIAPDGTYYGRGWYFRDITDRKHVEAELRAHQEHLEARVLARTRELEMTAQRLREEVDQRRQAEVELAKRVEELVRSNAELERFAYIASHDVREALRMVASYVQLLERRYEGALDEEAQEYIAFAVEGVHRIQELVGDILDYSRTGGAAHDHEPVDLEGVVKAASDGVRATLEGVGGSITHGALPTVRGDAGELVLVFQNLFSNGLKFQGAQAPRIRVDAHRQGGRWEVRVADNGLGIDPRYSERIFEMFQRLHPRGRYPGTGIGLAICKKLIENHGGEIWVTSSPDGGSVFHLTLKAADNADHPGSSEP